MNDILVKNNIIKMDKIIVDLGAYEIKIVYAHYSAKKIEITDTKLIDTGGVYENGGMDIIALAKKLDENLKGKGRNNIILILPTYFTENKIISIKNKKLKDIGKIIAKDYHNFGKVSDITHFIDFSYLGTTEKQGDTLHYCLLSGVSKTFMNELTEEFAEKKMKITTVVPSIFSQIALSELFFDDYDDLNRLFVDFGADNIKVTAFEQGIAVYTRTLDYGFSTYEKTLFENIPDMGKAEIKEALYNTGGIRTGEYDKALMYVDKEAYYKAVYEVDNLIINELQRIISMCSNNDVDVTQIYYTGFMIPGFEDKLTFTTGIKCRKIDFDYFYEKEAKEFMLYANAQNTNEKFSNAIGASIYPLL